MIAAAFGLARLGCVASPVSVRGLTQQRHDGEAPVGISKSGCQPRIPIRYEVRGLVPMMLIGIDPHKSTHTATAVDPDTHQEIASIRIEATLGEYRRMLIWAARWPHRRWVIENAEGLGRHLASWLLARGEEVLDVSPTATARIRQLSRGGGRKNDRIDAAAAACVAALHGDVRTVEPEGEAEALAVFDERRVNLAQSRVRAVNQLHALLRALLAGGAPRNLSAASAAALLRTVRPQGAVEQARKAVARDLVAEIRSLDQQLKANEQAIAELVAASGRQHLDRNGGSRPDHGWAADQPHWPRQSLSHLLGLRQLRRGSADRDCQRGEVPPPTLPPRGPAAQFRAAHHRHHSDPHAHQPRSSLLQGQDRTGQDPARGHPMPEKTPGRPSLAGDDQRRNQTSGTNPTHRSSRLTDTEAPTRSKGTSAHGLISTANGALHRSPHASSESGGDHSSTTLRCLYSIYSMVHYWCLGIALPSMVLVLVSQEVPLKTPYRWGE